jgi:hypothetical protein
VAFDVPIVAAVNEHEAEIVRRCGGLVIMIDSGALKPDGRGDTVNLTSTASLWVAAEAGE